MHLQGWLKTVFIILICKTFLAFILWINIGWPDKTGTEREQINTPVADQRELNAPVNGIHAVNVLKSLETLPNPKIPKIFHQTSSSVHVFSRYRPYIESCLRLNPDWKYYLWTEGESNLFIKNYYPKLFHNFRRFKNRMERTDAIRYVILHKFGGIYLDMDIECLQPFMPFMANITAFAGKEMEAQSRILYHRDLVVLSGALGSVPGHPLFQRVIDTLSNLKEPFAHSMISTGPFMLTDQVMDYWIDSKLNAMFPFTLLPSVTFYSIMDDGVRWTERCKKPFSSQTRKIGCALLAGLNWTLEEADPTNSNRIGKHYWIHLGWTPDIPTEERFNAAEKFKGRIRFYSRERK